MEGDPEDSDRGDGQPEDFVRHDALPEGVIVLFYGGTDYEWLGDDFVQQTHAAFLGHFAEYDPYEPGELVPKLENELRVAGREVAFYVYPGTGHWFFEDNRPGAYDADAAQLAWQRTLAFLHNKLD